MPRCRPKIPGSLTLAPEIPVTPESGAGFEPVTFARAAGGSAQVILFESHARGDAHTSSDLDFLVIEPRSTTVAEWGEVKSTMSTRR